MEYKIITSSTLKGLERKVNEAIQDGWELLGGVSYHQACEARRSAQAMIRKGGVK